MKELTTKEENTIITLINDKIWQCTNDNKNIVKNEKNTDKATMVVLNNIKYYNDALIHELVQIRDKIIDL